MIRFSNGVTFDTDGEYRIERRFDGMYVVGHGILCPVRDVDEARALIGRLTEKRRTT